MLPGIFNISCYNLSCHAQGYKTGTHLEQSDFFSDDASMPRTILKKKVEMSSERLLKKVLENQVY